VLSELIAFTIEDDAVAGYGYVKIVAEAISKVGPNSQRIAAYVHAHTFNIPGYAWPLKWTAWGEMIGSRPQYAILTRGTPPDVVNTLSRAIAKGINAPDTKAFLSNMGVEPAGTTPQEFAAFIKSEMTKWAKVVKESGAKVD